MQDIKDFELDQVSGGEEYGGEFDDEWETVFDDYGVVYMKKKRREW